MTTTVETIKKCTCSTFQANGLKVTFALYPIIIILEEDEDRKGPWELFAVDRDRFNRRIKDVESKIGWCFEPKHREKILRRLEA